MNLKFINLPQKPMENPYFLPPVTFSSFLDEYELINKGVKFKERKNTNMKNDPIKLFLKNVMDALSMKSSAKNDVMGNFVNHNAQKFREIMKAAKRQRTSLVNNLKRKTAIERNLMKKRVMELNNKLKALKKVYKAQKKKLKKGKKMIKGPELSLHNKPSKNQKSKKNKKGKSGKSKKSKEHNKQKQKSKKKDNGEKSKSKKEDHKKEKEKKDHHK